MRALPPLGLATAFSSLFVACAVASGEVSGGDARIDATAPPAPVIEKPDTGAPPRDSGAGTTFTDIYRDLFGPTGVASCTGVGKCHGGATHDGALGSTRQGAGGYVCAASKSECRSTLLSSGLITAGETDFTKSYVHGVLRKKTAGGTETEGTMPKSPADFVFTKEELDRIAAWVAAGTPDN